MIVICDFVVLSMMSLFSGSQANSSPFGSSGTVIDDRSARLIMEQLARQEVELVALRSALSARRDTDAEAEKKLEKLREELAEVRLKKEYLGKSLALKREEAGSLSPEQLQRQLQSELRRRMILRGKYEEAADDLARLRREYAESRNVSAEELARQKKEIREAQEKIARYRENIAARDNALRGMNRQLLDLQKARKETDLTLKTYESELAFTRGRLSAAERDLAESRSAAARSSRMLSAKDIEISDAKRRLADMQAMLKKAVGDLSRTQNELRQVKTSAAATAEALAGTRSRADAKEEEIRRLEAKSKTDVFDCYAQSVVALNCRMREKRLLLDINYDEVFYLPVIGLGGKKYAVGDIRTIVGASKGELSYRKLTLFSLLMSSPEKRETGVSIKDRMDTVAQLPGVALFPLPEKFSGRRALPVCSLELLKKNGVSDLYLFKSRSFGKESCALGGRASLSLSADDCAIYIRNSNNTGELKAEIGDFVMTRNGEFAGVVTAIENSRVDRKGESRCSIFPEKIALHPVEFGTLDGEGYYTRLGESLRKIVEF